MPSYVYECSACEEVVEVFHSMSCEKKDCDICGAENTLRKIPEVPIYVKNPPLVKFSDEDVSGEDG